MNRKLFGYNQEALAKWSISLSEACLLEYLKQYFESGRAQKFDANGKIYYKIYYTKILDDNLALQIGEERLRKMLRSLEARGWLDRYKQRDNSSTLYLRVTDRRLTYNQNVTRLAGKDTMLGHLIKSTWQVRKNGRSAIEIFLDEHGNEHMVYTNTFLQTGMITPYMDLFIRKLFQNLSMCMTREAFLMIKPENVIVIHNKIEISTINNGTLIPIFEEYCYQIETAICLAYVEIFKEI